jgi:hypothetical protein
MNDDEYNDYPDYYAGTSDDFYSPAAGYNYAEEE